MKENQCKKEIEKRIIITTIFDGALCLLTVFFFCSNEINNMFNAGVCVLIHGSRRIWYQKWTARCNTAAMYAVIGTLRTWRRTTVKKKKKRRGRCGRGAEWNRNGTVDACALSRANPATAFYTSNAVINGDSIFTTHAMFVSRWAGRGLRKLQLKL